MPLYQGWFLKEGGGGGGVRENKKEKDRVIIWWENFLETDRQTGKYLLGY